MLESLRDAMDDLHYVNALHEGRLPPTRPIPKLPDKEIFWYIDNLRTNKPESFELENICAEPLGFYLVRIVLYCFHTIFPTSTFSLLHNSLQSFSERMAKKI